MRKPHVPAFVAAVAFAATCALGASTLQTVAAPATQPAFPDWAMKAFPDDITRLMRFDRVKEAEALGDKQLAALANAPDKTTEYLQTVVSMCHLYLALNRSEEAQKLLSTGLKALDAAKLPGKEKDLDVARAGLEGVQSSLALSRDQPDRAAEFAKSALARLQKDLPAGDVRIIDQQLEVEHLKIRTAGEGTVADAFRVFSDAIKGYTAALGTEECAPIADVYMSRGYYYLNNIKNLTRATADFTQARKVRQNIYGENSEVGDAMEALALIATINNDDDGAIKLLREARTMTLKVIGEDDPAVAGIDMSIAAALDRKGSPDEAEKLLVKAVSVFEKYPDTKDQLADALDLLSEHYGAHGNDDKANETKDRANKIREDMKKHQEL